MNRSLELEREGAAAAPDTRRVSVLIVDDHEENLLALEAVLGPLGHEVVTARSGPETLKRLLERDFAVIILDVLMPGMDGFETAALIRQRDRTRYTPIIFLTAISRSDAFVFKGYTSGAVDYILKPFVPEIMRAKVTVFVDLFNKTERIRRQTQGLEERARELARINVELQEEIALRRRAQEELAFQAQELQRSNAELEHFAYIASHDLLEPLRKVAGFVELLAARYRGKLDPQADEYIRYIVDGAARMQSLIAGLLEYSRAGHERRPLERVDVGSVVDKAIRNLSVLVVETKASVERGGMPTLVGDPLQLMQLFQNLIANALKYRGPTPPVVRVSADRLDGAWLFTVRDNGIGIDPAHHQRIFTLFKRLHGRGKYAGAGLGLAICKKVVERHGGEIWVESAAGAGAAFRFKIPADA